MRIRFGNNKGFTLVELIVVIAILGIVSMAVVTVFSYTLNSFRISDLRSKEQYEARSAMDLVKKEISVASIVKLRETIPATKPQEAGYGYCYYDSVTHRLVLHTPEGTNYFLISNLPETTSISVLFSPISVNDEGTIFNTVNLNWKIGEYLLSTNVYIQNGIDKKSSNVTDNFTLGNTAEIGVYLEYIKPAAYPNP